MDKETQKYLLEQCRDWMLEEEIKALRRFGFNKQSETEQRKLYSSSNKIDYHYGFQEKKVNDLVSLGSTIAEKNIARRVL